MKLIARHGERNVDVEVERQGTSYRVRVGDRWFVADLIDVGRFGQSLRLEDGTQYALTHHREGTLHEINFPGTTVQVEMIDPLAMRRKRREDEVGSGGLVKALMPGRVVRVLVNPGDVVRKGAGLVILEAMKMENEIQAPVEGAVDQIFVQPGQTVESGADLVHISPPV